MGQRIEDLDSVNPAFFPISLSYWIPFVVWLCVLCWSIRTERGKRLMQALEMPLVLAIFLGSCWGFVAAVVQCLGRAVMPLATSLELVTLDLFLSAKSSLWGFGMTAVALVIASARSASRSHRLSEKSSDKR